MCNCPKQFLEIRGSFFNKYYAFAPDNASLTLVVYDHSWGLKGFRIDCIINQVQIPFCFGDKLWSSAAFGVNCKTVENLLVPSAVAHTEGNTGEGTTSMHRAETQKEEGGLLRKMPQEQWRSVGLYVTWQPTLELLKQIGSKRAPV